MYIGTLHERKIYQGKYIGGPVLAMIKRISAVEHLNEARLADCVLISFHSFFKYLLEQNSLY